ncbi:MAG: HAMP domain-containing protein, partial [Magnetococcales bacterium]|nr:HAMP domain-containing protein [Magnetococcales bacterium]
SWSKYRNLMEEVNHIEDLDEAHRVYFAEAYPAFLNVKELIDRVRTVNENAITSKSNAVHDLAKWLAAFMIASTLLALISAASITFFLIGRMLRPLSILTQAAHRLGSGDTLVRARVEGKDEIAHLAHEFNTMADHLEQFRQSSLGKLHYAQQIAQSAINSLPDPVLVYDGEGEPVTTNLAGNTFLLPATEEGGKRTLAGEIPQEVATLFQRVVQHVLSGKGAWRPASFTDAVHLSSDEGSQWFLLHAQPMLGEGEVSGVTLLLQDVTRLRRFEELKNDLVSTVAHEFRTPLTSLHMAIHLCLDETVGVVNESQISLLQAADEDCQRLQSMVNDMLDISRIQSGRIDMKRRPLAIETLLEAAWDRYRGMAENKGVNLLLHNGDDKGAEVLADGDRIGLVLSNLLTNALRHTPAGGTILLTWQLKHSMAILRVVDSGEGIPLHYQSRVFDKFFRVPGSGGSSGLGLAICREVVEAHGGSMGVESQPGKGSNFWFSLQLA